METSIFVAGSGGHGIQNLGKTLVWGALANGLEATCYPRYGIEKRGGYSSCYLVFSEEAIGNVKKARSDVVIVIDDRAFRMFSGTVKEGGTLIVNSSTVTAEGAPEHVTRVDIPIIDMALALGDLRAISTILTGLIAGIPGLLADPDKLRRYIAKKWEKNAKVQEMNLKAFDAGLPLGQALSLPGR